MPDSPDVDVPDNATDTAAVLRARLLWVRHYEKSKNAGLTCLRCGISRPTLQKWWNRFQEKGEAGLRSQSRRRKTPSERKLSQSQEQELLTLRKKRRLGPKRLQSEMMRQEKVHVSTATISFTLA